MKPFTDLVVRWRTHAETLAAYGDGRGAALLRTTADELEAAMAAHVSQPLTLAEAASESGYSKSRLGHMIGEGTLPNAGRHGSPRIRRGDLPKRSKPQRSPNDTNSIAARVLR